MATFCDARHGDKTSFPKEKTKVTVPKIDLVGAGVGFESDGDYEFAGYESDEYAKQLLAEAMAPSAAAGAEEAQEGEL